MSHEIRTPLNGILGFGNLITKKDLSNKDRERYSEFINQNGHLLLKLINDIIEISKIQENMLTINIQEFDLHQLIKNIEKGYGLPGSALQKKGLELRVINDIYSHPLMITSDPDRLLQILTNLIDNAIKYTDEGFVSIGYQLDENMIHIYVKDTGIGIKKENQALIFERFKQTSAKKYQGDGVGLGLSISRGIAEALNGAIKLDSEPGKGSRFTVILPLNATT